MFFIYSKFIIDIKIMFQRIADRIQTSVSNTGDSICNVQEMLQIDSCTINTCDFFHGPFEILDKRTSLFQLISVGRSRCNDERGIRFVNQYGGERVYQLDAKELGLNDIKDSVSEYFNHLIFAPILNNVYMRALSAVTHKDYMTRRYMWKLDY